MARQSLFRRQSNPETSMPNKPPTLLPNNFSTMATLTTLFLSLTLLPHLTTAATITCPSNPTRDGTILNLTGLPTPTATITLANTPTGVTGNLCTLFTLLPSEDNSKLFYIPVGRSYDGYDWERAAGKYDYLNYDCSAGDGTCTVTLPTEGQDYVLTSYFHLLTSDQISARFFEKATFGPTSDLLPLGSTEADMASWIQSQFDRSVTPMTSHREYFRKRLNPHSLELWKYGRSGPHACASGSYWRNYAFTRKDATMSTYENENWPMKLHDLTIESKTVNGVEKFLLRFAGYVRTMVDARPQLAINGTEIEDGDYDICEADELPGSVFADQEDIERYASLQIRFNGTGDETCYHIVGGNPEVHIDEAYLADEDPTEVFVLDLSAESASLTEIGNQESSAVVLFTNENFYDDNLATCAPLPDPNMADFRAKGWIYSPYYEGRKHPDWDPAYHSVLDPPVYAKMPNGGYMLHDRRLTLVDNTPEEPLPDGGGDMTMSSIYIDINNEDADDPVLVAADHDENPRTYSKISGNEQAIYCANNEPNVFNEPFCKLSTEPNACVREGIDDEDTMVVTRLSPTSLSRINFHAATNLFEITGLTFRGTERLPCEDGATSRWVVMEGVADKTACDALGSTTVGTGTYAAFETLLYYKYTDNPVVFDIVMHEKFPGLACDQADIDAEAREFAIYVAAHSACYLHTHHHNYDVYAVYDEDVNIFGSDGKLVWGEGTDASLTMDYWYDNRGNSLLYEKFGTSGDVEKLEPLMEKLGVYIREGGLPVTEAPTGNPSAAPSYGPSLSEAPTLVPSLEPSIASDAPSSSFVPSDSPSESKLPSLSPSESPSESMSPSSGPSASSGPSIGGSESPSMSSEPSKAPSDSPSTSAEPSSVPSDAPSTSDPSSMPSDAPSSSEIPSILPTESFAPSDVPSNVPSDAPSISTAPSDLPSMTAVPSLEPSQLSQIARTTNDQVFFLIANDPDIAYIISETQYTRKSGGVLVCGSDGEIASDPTEDDYFDYWNMRLDSTDREGEQKKTVWTSIALSGEDQLRQRIAFALSQIFTISPDFLGYSSLSEAHMYYYDIFVRNADLTYRDVLKRIGFAVKMGMQLSHVTSVSVRYYMDAAGTMIFPDENYAREIMQLETIGLEMLNMDGTVIKDSVGIPVPTYDINDILTFARAWTGFNYAPRRGNYEELDYISKNWMDPLTLKDGDKRDWFPKKDLFDGWIGDRYPLCSDMSKTPQSFLKTGAIYKLIGRGSTPRYQYMKDNWEKKEDLKRMTLDPDSNLFSLLCAESNGSCTFPSVVELSSDIACYGIECDLDILRVIQVTPDVFYEYVRRPCVHLTFLDDAKTVFAGTGGGAAMCANPGLPVATTTCCASANTLRGETSCVYHGEQVNYYTNLDRCGAGNTCPVGTNRLYSCGSCCVQTGFSDTHPNGNYYQWTDGDCITKMKVRLDGMAAIIHEPDSATKIIKYVGNTVDNMNFFHLPWPKDNFVGDELFPHIDNDCGNQTCTLQDDWTCLCNVTITNSAAFTSEPSDSSEILSKLKIGAFEPNFFGTLYDAAITHSTDSNVEIYHLASSNGYSEETIFKLPDEFGNTIYLKNLESLIEVGDDINGYYLEPQNNRLIMRNPLAFHDLVKPEVRDAHYETDAVIDHLIRHPNTPPFVGKQLIQHFGIANPSPRYVEVVAQAFKTGTYTSSSGVTFGDGELSDLKATVAAILLDREATAGSLDADPTYGAIREPVIKVLAFMRAMNYVRTPHDRNIYPKLYDMYDKVGQMAHESPDQFSFFLPDYLPPGQFAQSLLFAPAAQVLTLSTTIGTVEGLFSLVRNGLSSQDGGFGAWGLYYDWTKKDAGDYSRSVGYLSYNPSGTTSAEKVEQIADLLTSGRLHPDALSQVVTAFDDQLDDATKIRVAQQLIATAPEFHTTNLMARDEDDREPSPIKERSDDPYKAIVVILLSGGLDSFGVLTPHYTCDLFKSYYKTRSVLALRNAEMFGIWSNDPEQPCEAFGVNRKIPAFKDIYNNGHGIFFANNGHLAKPVTKNNWFTETRTHLFSHKTMEREAQLVDAFQEDGWSTGVLGRMLDVLQRRGMSVVANGIDGKGPIVEGNPSLGRTVDVIPSGGVNTLTRSSLTDSSQDLDSIEPLMAYLNKESKLTSGLFANYWAQNLIDTLNRTEYLKQLFSETNLINDGLFNGGIGRKLRIVSKMMLNHAERSVNRDTFYLHMGGYDGHALSKEILQSNLPVVNEGISAFYKEMTDQGMLDQVTVAIISEFGRTITPNSGLGSDHAWGGNSFVFGGQINGSKILGPYPESFEHTDPTHLGRGRLIPSRSWESMWYGIANWFGITDAKEMDYVLPNNGNFGCQLFTDKDMYVGGNNTVSGCNDRAVNLKLSMFINEPRYLTGLEQKRICKAAIAQVSKNANVTSRCIVVDQQVLVSFDNNRRELLTFANGTRRLEGATYTVESTVAMDYDDTENKTGAEFIENVDGFTAAMNEELTGNCTDPCEFKLDLVDEVLEFLADTSEAPSLAPSVSYRPSQLPSHLPSNFPSEEPSHRPSQVPSNVPSLSTMPSKSPTSEPSDEPSLSTMPSKVPSDSPSDSPSISSEPSMNPTRFPTQSPTSKPSSSPSDSPSVSQDPTVSIVPTVSSTDSPTENPTENPTESASPTAEIEPPTASPTLSSRPSRDCSDVVPNTCENPSGIWSPYTCECLSMQLKRNAKFTMVGVTCPSNDNEIAVAAREIAKSAFSVICGSVPGLTCRDGDKLVVNKFCNKSLNEEVEYPLTRRSLQTSGSDEVEITLILHFVADQDLRQTDELLNQYFQGSTLDTLLAAIVQEVIDTAESPSLQTITTLYYEFTNSFINGLGLYYPGWGVKETCLNDGNQKDYMNRNPSAWLYPTLEACCQRYYSWDEVGCLQVNAELTQVSSSGSSIVAHASDVLYYPDWGGTDTCINDGNAPAYMKKQYNTWMYGNLIDCCKTYYGWDEGYAKCIGPSGSSSPTSSPITDAWYIDWKKFECVQGCNGAPPCGGTPQKWNFLHPSKEQCCEEHLWWKEDCL